MIRSVGYSSLAALLLTAFVYVSEVSEASDASDADAGFFITSVGPGKGADLGGLGGADAHCQKLAVTAGAAERLVQALRCHCRTQKPGTIPTKAAAA